ncbi:hypothetical protein H1R20_g13125, partial [Candolleomyces eurysporus]
MGDRSKPFGEFSRARHPGARNVTLRDVNVVHYHGTVNHVGYAENGIFGNNYGIIHQGSGRLHLAAEEQQNVFTDEADLIQLLQPILDASHTRDRETSPPNSACFPGTRTDVICGIVAWADSALLWNTHVLWLHGYVGCGKSAIALAIALKFERRKRLVGSFFFFRNTGDRRRMTRFATTLACQLAAAIPEAAPFIKKAVREEPGLLGSSLVAQLRRLVYEPFKAAAKRARLFKTSLLKGPFLIVIDGLDECEDLQDVQAFIDDMLDFFKKNPLVPLRFFITSRVEQHIQSHLKNDQVRLENLVNHCSRQDIYTFMTTCFEVEKLRNPVISAYIQEHGDWPTTKDKDQLVDHIGGSFIFGSALFKYIADPTGQSTPMDRLPHTLNMNPGLDTLYAKTLSRSRHLPHFSDIISTLVVLFEPLPTAGIAQLLGIQSFEVIRVLVNLQAIIHIPGTNDLPVTMCHTSLRDFLTTESRSGCFFTPPSYHLYLLYRCSTLHNGQRPDTVAALYSIARCAEHLEQFTRLPPSAQGPFPRFPRTLDALYTDILAKSRHLPHFSDIISTIALLIEPLPVAGISELLGIETFEVVAVLLNLQAIINIPETNSSPVTLCHKSVNGFLMAESRSGPFFISPWYHLKLSYYCFSLNLERLLSNAPLSPARRFSIQHWNQFLNAVSEQSILAELKQLPHPPYRISSRHLFSFAQVFIWLFRDDSVYRPQQVLHSFTSCIESLALALENDPAPDRWLPLQFYSLGLYGLMRKDVQRLNIHQEQATALQHNVERIEKAIMAKCPSRLTDSPSTHNVDRFSVSDSWLGDWTPIEAFRQLLKWIAIRVQPKANFAGPGAITHDLDLRITQGDGPGTRCITICPAAQPTAA